MAKDNIQFQKIDVDTLPADQFDAFVAYLKAKEAFKASLQSLAPTGHKVVFAEKYGTVANPQGSALKVAMVKATQPKAATGKSLADFFDAQDAAGLAR